MKLISMIGLLTFASILTACGGTTPTPVVTEINGTVTGQAAVVSGGKAVLEFSATDKTTQTSKVVVQTTVGADGKFKIVLPTPEQLTPYLETYATQKANPDCTGSLGDIPLGTKSTSIARLTLTDGDGQQKSIRASNSVKKTNGTIVENTSVSHEWIYVNAAFNLVGSQTCHTISTNQDSTTVSNSNAKFNAGWNILKIEGTSSTDSATKKYNATFGVTVIEDLPSVWVDSSQVIN
jgi:hypothetical protein